MSAVLWAYLAIGLLAFFLMFAAMLQRGETRPGVVFVGAFLAFLIWPSLIFLLAFEAVEDEGGAK